MLSVLFAEEGHASLRASILRVVGSLAAVECAFLRRPYCTFSLGDIRKHPRIQLKLFPLSAAIYNNHAYTR